MSESSATPDPGMQPPTGPSQGTEPTPGPAKKRSKWPRRIFRTIMTILILAGVLRIALTFVLPSVIRKAAAHYEMDASWERIQLNIMGGDFGIWHLKLTPRGGGETIAHAEYCRGNVSILALLKGRLEIWRVEADGLSVNAWREADGRIPLIARFRNASSDQSPVTPGSREAPATSSGATGARMTLTSPLKMDALRAHQMRIHWRDLAVQPVIDTEVRANVRVSDLGSLVRPARIEMDLEATAFLDSLQLRLDRWGDDSHSEAHYDLTVRGLHLKPAEPYLAPLGLKPVADRLDFRFRAKATASVTTRPSAPPCIVGDTTLYDIYASADDQEAAFVKTAYLGVKAFDFDSLEAEELLLEGVRVRGARTALGTLRAAGLELVTPQAAQPKHPTSGPLTRHSIPFAPPSTAPGGPFRFRLANLKLRDIDASFLDANTVPPTRLTASIDHIHSKDILLDPSRPDVPFNIDALFKVPGIAESISIRATANPFSTTRSVDVRFSATGITGNLLRPYLEPIGLEPVWKDGTLQCTLHSSSKAGRDGNPVMQLRLSELKLADGAELMALDHIDLAGVSHDSASGRTRVEAIEIVGPSGMAQRDPRGLLTALGFRVREQRTLPTPPIAAAAPAKAVPTAATRPSQPLPSIEIGKLTWKGLNLQLEDQTTRPATTLAIRDGGIELTGLLFDLNSKADNQRPGRVRVSLKAPDIARDLEIVGTITPRPRAVSADLTLRGEQIDFAKLKPYLAALNVEPVARNATLSGKVIVDISNDEGRIRSSASVSGLQYTTEDKALAGVDSLKVSSAEFNGKVLALGNVDVQSPRLAAARLTDGSLVIAGMRLVPAKVPATRPAGAVQQPRPAATTPVVASSIASPFSIEKLTVRNAMFDWADDTVAATVRTTANVDLVLGRFSLDPSSAPSSIRLVLRAPGTVDSLTIDGTVRTNAKEQSARLRLAAQGITSGPLTAYLPPQMRFMVKDGRLQAAVEASATRNAKGGQAVALHLTGVDYTQPGEKSPLLKFDALHLIASRVDPPARVFSVDELSVAGLETSIVLDKGGITRVMGMQFQSASPTNVRAMSDFRPALVAADPGAAALALDGQDNPAPPQVRTTLGEAARLAAQSRSTIPALTLDKLDVKVRHLSLVDLSRPGSAPIEVHDLTLRNLDRIDVGGADPSAKPPAKVHATARIDPLIRKIELQSTASPFAREPSIQLTLAATGINGDALAALLPEIRDALAPSAMNEGTLKAHVEAQAKLDRRTADDFDFSRGFELTGSLKQLEFRAAPDGPILAGVEELNVENARVRPASGSVIIKSLEINKPIGAVKRDQLGFHFLGLVFRVAEKLSTRPSSQPATQVAPTQVRAPVTAVRAPASQPTTKPAGEIRIDRLTISGLDLRYEDRAVNPPLIIPLTGLDVDIRDLSNWSPYEDKPIRFNVLVDSGKIVLPKKPRGAGIPGAIGDIAGLMGGQKIEPKLEYEERELFSQVAASGKVSLYPAPNGWAKSSVNGLELVGLAGTARDAGLNIGLGTYDSKVDLRFPGDGSIDVRSRLTFTDLRMSEPASGPVARHINLPGPLDTVIGMLQDADGSITLPVNFTFREGQAQDLGGAVFGAVGSVIATAFASAPVKVAAGVGDLLGLGAKKQPGQEDPVMLTFLPGLTVLESDQRAALEKLIQRLQKEKDLELTLRHDLGGGDIAIAQDRANPTAEAATALAYQLRAHKLELSTQRSIAAGRARALLTTATAELSSTAVQSVRDIDRELAATEDALDRVYELMRAGADRQAARRTRQASLSIGLDRLQAIRAALIGDASADVYRRVRMINPQFNPDESDQGGRITIQIIKKKRA